VTFEIEVNGRVRQVSVERPGAGRYVVSLDGTMHEVDACRLAEYGFSLLLDGQAHTSREVYVVPGDSAGRSLVALEGRSVAVTINGRRTRRTADDVASAEGEQKILAPMPGRIVRVLAAPGDRVEARQPVIVVEAMKMENELRAPRAGRIKHIGVTPGMSVEGGRVLMVIE